MKTRICISIIVLFCLACTNNKPVSESERQQITDEVKQVTAKIIGAAEKADFEAIVPIYYDSPDNTLLTPEGKSVSFNEWIEMIRGLFSTMQSQKINTIAESYRVLDRNTVWYTNVSKTQVNLKDSSILMQDPWSMYFLFKKINNEWRWVAGTEYGYEEITKPSPLPKEIDQLELSKQMLGRWRCEFEDTAIIYDQQPFGKSQVVSVTTTVKGKPIKEERQLWCFDRTHNRLTFMAASKNGMGGVVSLKFNTPTTYTTIPYNNISNPEYARFRIEGEFTDPDTYVEKLIINNETVKTFTSKRIK